MKYFICLLLAFSFTSSFAQDSKTAAQEKTSEANETSDKVLTESETTIDSAAAPVEFGDVTGTQKYKYTCTSGSDVREIAVITQEDNSVGVVYKKADSTKTIVLAKNDPAYADEKAEKVKGNLETAGFTCTKE